MSFLHLDTEVPMRAHGIFQVSPSPASRQKELVTQPCCRHSELGSEALCPLWGVGRGGVCPWLHHLHGRCLPPGGWLGCLLPLSAHPPGRQSWEEHFWICFLFLSPDTESFSYSPFLLGCQERGFHVGCVGHSSFMKTYTFQSGQ